MWKPIKRSLYQNEDMELKAQNQYNRSCHVPFGKHDDDCLQHDQLSYDETV